MLYHMWSGSLQVSRRGTRGHLVPPPSSEFAAPNTHMHFRFQTKSWQLSLSPMLVSTQGRTKAARRGDETVGALTAITSSSPRMSLGTHLYMRSHVLRIRRAVPLKPSPVLLMQGRASFT